MAKIENLTILNPADKTHLYAVAIGKGAPADVDDRLVIKNFLQEIRNGETANK